MERVGDAGSGRWQSILRWLSLTVLALAVVATLRPLCWPTAQERSRALISAALRARDPRGDALAQEHIRTFPSHVEGVALAAEAAAQSGRHEECLELLSRLPQDGGRWEFVAAAESAERLMVLGQLSKAEGQLRQALALDPADIDCNSRLGHLLQVSSRVWESSPNFFTLIQNGKCRGDELLGMSAAERFFRSEERLEQLGRAADPPEPLILLADARRAMMDNRTDEAERLLRTVLSARPELGEAQGRLGRIIFDRGDDEEFLLWLAGLPLAARSHPEVWYVQGLKARRLGQVEGAAHCLLQALEQSPNHLGGNVQFAGCLEQLGLADAAGLFSDRAKRLAELETTLNALRSDLSEDLLLRAISNLGEMGRYWEAAGWSLLATHVSDTKDVDFALRRWMPLAVRGSPANTPAALPARRSGVSPDDFRPPSWPVPSRSSPAIEAPLNEREEDEDKVVWSFTDEAAAAGIQFQYFEGTDEEHRLEHIFNVMGGGLAAIDYDMDLWPDLYLAQANDWRNVAPQPQYLDPLYRNLGGQQFVEVTEAAGVGDLSFSHGVTVGDFNQDGFPDVYIGNKGANRLYCNLGDGTFEDVTGASGVAGDDEDWTTSSVFADFNADGLPDLYVLNYTFVEATAEKECEQAGRPAACTPDVLPACPDRCYVNRGDGTFVDATAASGLNDTDGRGLGVVAWRFGNDDRLGLFVANDTTANHLYLNEGSDRDGVPQLVEAGAVRGVAFDVDGNAQASMGVAAGDATGDGRIDLFITNFFAESNTFYSQGPDGFFQDLARPLQLRDSAFWMLGFGCQFADLDGDGWLDIIATNGHVDRHSSRGDPDRMPPQVFHNAGGQSFSEAPAHQLGPFFQTPQLGRGLAVVDWNRDGAPDVVISHLHAPLALLTNRSRNTSSETRRLFVKLIGSGKAVSRDPTGAVVRVSASGVEQIRLQTAGDGFLVTNERFHTFSLPAGVGEASIGVRWPDGTEEAWTVIPGTSRITLVQGRGEVYAEPVE